MRAPSAAKFTHDYVRRAQIARCAGDLQQGDPADWRQWTVTTDPSSCPDGGIWTRWEYADANWPAKVTLERTRSRVQPGGFHDVQYQYDSGTGELKQRNETGWTRDLNGSVVSETLVETWSYGPYGVEEYFGPAGEYTQYVYYTSGPHTGLLQQKRVYAAQGAFLETTYADYSPLGQPEAVFHPSSAATTYSYEYGGMRLLTRADEGLTTTYAYDASGRLEDVTEPTGRRTNYSYDTLGRVQHERVYDSPGTGWNEQTQYAYDEAGRTTSVSVRRVSSTGTEYGVVASWGATYDDMGFTTSRQNGSVTEQITRDPAGTGDITRIDRADGGYETFAHDAFGRETEFAKHFGSSSGLYLSRYDQPAGTTAPDARPTDVTDPGGMSRSYVYDDFGRLVESQAVDFGTQRWQYSSGRLVGTRWPSGKTTYYGYDPMGRLTSIDNDATDWSGVGQDYFFFYDNGDGVVPCNVTYETGHVPCYYRTGRLARVDFEVAPSTLWSIEYDYAADGQVQAERMGARQTTYEYDTGRLVRLRFPSGSGDMVRYEYDAATGDRYDATEVRSVIGELGSPGWDYVAWATHVAYDAANRFNSARLSDSGGSYTSASLSYRTDGQVSRWWALRNTPTGTEYVVDRTYQFSSDGMVKSYNSTVPTDPARRFSYDGANRLTCAVNDTSLTSCPTAPDSRLVQSWEYDEAGNPLTRSNKDGLTSFAPWENTLWDEYLPTTTLWYAYELGPGGGRAYDMDPGTAYSRRDYFYDGIGRLRTIALDRPGASPGSYEAHEITIIYDHLSRPVYVTDLNTVSGEERREELFWDPQDRLITRITTPDSTSPADYVLDMYAHVTDSVVGSIRLDYTGSGPFERWFYDLRDPMGLPAARYEHYYGSASTSVAWTGEWSPFGELLSYAGEAEIAPPWRFEGQLALSNSDVTQWSGPSLSETRSPVYMNQWRVYDPRVGQYVTAEPLAIGADVRTRVMHPYAYGNLAPMTFTDPSGLLPAPGTSTEPKSGVFVIVPIPVGGAAGGGSGAAAAERMRRLFTLLCEALGVGGAVSRSRPEAKGCRRVDPPVGRHGYRDFPTGTCRYECDFGDVSFPLTIDCAGSCPDTFENYPPDYCREVEGGP